MQVIVLYWCTDTTIILSINERNNVSTFIYSRLKSFTSSRSLQLLTLPDTSALHSWHIASPRSKKHHTADIFPPARNVFYCSKVQLTKVLVLKKSFVCRSECKNPVTGTVRHFDSTDITGVMFKPWCSRCHHDWSVFLIATSNRSSVSLSLTWWLLWF